MQRRTSTAAQWHYYIDEFALHQRAANLSEKTIRNREECLRLLERQSGRTPLEVTKRDLLILLGRPNPRTGKPLAAGTKQSERSYLQTFFAWMHAEGYRDTDPAAALPKVKVPRRRARPLRAGQVDDILDSGIYKRTRDIVTIAALSGLRIGEIVRIRGQDIDHVAGTLHSVRKGGLEHTVPLHPLLLEMAAEYPRTGWWFPTPGSNKLFPNGGGHILMASASDRIGKAIRSAGITDGRLTGHSLRHFYATTLLREGVNVRTVQEMLGHASLATTQLYMEVTDEEMVAAVAKMPAITRRRASQRSAATAQRARRDRIAA